MIKDFNLRNQTTYKIGGPALYFSTCNSIVEVQKAIHFAVKRNLPWFILGNGSNILVSDEGFPGLAIKLSGDFKKINFDANIVEVGAGVILPALSKSFLSMGWAGFEFMCGIPGTIGGAVRMNAGNNQGEIQDHFISALVLSKNGNLQNITKEEMDFSHRSSRLYKCKDTILSVKFKMHCLETPKHIKEKIKLIIADRRSKQPKNRRSCGSVFKKPEGGKPAGWYIEQAGLKGFRIGDAMIAFEHANWIINVGNAKAVHVKVLIRRIQDDILKTYGVFLKREVVYVPEDIIGDYDCQK